MKEKLCIIDRFEGEWAVIEYEKKTFNIPKDLLHPQVVEGDIVDITVISNKDETQKRKQMIESLSRQLFKN